MGWLVLLICGVLAAVIASSKGRNPVGWFFGGFFLHIIGIVIVAVLPDLKAQRAEREYLERENRRLRERIRQEQVKNEAFRRHATKRLDVHDGHLRIDTRQVSPPLPALEESVLALPAHDQAMEPATTYASGLQGDGEVEPLVVPARARELGRDWHYEASGGSIGPISEVDLVGKFRSGELNGSTLVWTSELEDWKAAGQVSALKPFLSS